MITMLASITAITVVVSQRPELFGNAHYQNQSTPTLTPSATKNTTPILFQEILLFIFNIISFYLLLFFIEIVRKFVVFFSVVAFYAISVPQDKFFNAIIQRQPTANGTIRLAGL